MKETSGWTLAHISLTTANFEGFSDYSSLIPFDFEFIVCHFTYVWWALTWSLTHLICCSLMWKLRALTRTSSVKGGLSSLRWRSKWAEFERAWTPVSVLLDTDRDTGLTGLSLLIASCTKTGKNAKLSVHTKCRKSLEKVWRALNQDYLKKKLNLDYMLAGDYHSVRILSSMFYGIRAKMKNNNI